MDDENLRTQFGAMVRKRRNRLGLSQENLAARAGLHRTYVADIERGARNPSLGSIDKLAKALEVSIAALFAPGTNPATPAEEGLAEAGGQEAVDILLVEDSQPDAELALRAFKRAHLGNRIHWVRDGAEALAFVLCTGAYAGRRLLNRPKVVLLDLNLPRVDGIEVLRQIKDNEWTREIPVVVLTVSERDRDITECRLLGADAYIVKPLDFHRLSQVTPQLNLNWLLLRVAKAT